MIDNIVKNGITIQMKKLESAINRLASFHLSKYQQLLPIKISSFHFCDSEQLGASLKSRDEAYQRRQELRRKRRKIKRALKKKLSVETVTAPSGSVDDDLPDLTSLTLSELRMFDTHRASSSFLEPLNEPSTSSLLPSLLDNAFVSRFTKQTKPKPVIIRSKWLTPPTYAEFARALPTSFGLQSDEFG